MIQSTPVGDSGALAVCGSEISEQVNAQVMALDAAYGFFLEFVHMEYEIGHGNTSWYYWKSRSFCGRNAGHFFSLRGTKVENLFGFGWSS